MKFVLHVLLLLAAISTGMANQRIAPEIFADEGQFSNVKLSLDGKYIAATVPQGDRSLLVIMQRSPHQLTASYRLPKGTHIADFWWVNEERVLIALAESFGSRDYPQATGELAAINIDGSRQELLVGWRVQEQKTGTRIKTKQEGLVRAHPVHLLPEDRKHILISTSAFTAEPYTRVERMDVYSGRRTTVASVPVPRASFTTDNEGQVRFALGATSDNHSKLYYRSGNKAEWELINDEVQTKHFRAPLGFSPDNRIAYMRVSHAKGPDSIVAYDVQTREEKEIARHAIVDPGTIRRADFGTPIGVRFHHGKATSVFFDPSSESARLMKMVEEAMPGHDVDLISTTSDNALKLLLATSDTDPGSYYLLDSTTRAMEYLMARKEKIDPEQMATRRSITFKARDDLALHGYLTLPRESSEKNLPMVLLPHGGPFGIHDDWTFDTDAQLLANAGYAVLQVNFRGSGNYGRAFRDAGSRQWGRTMQDDLTDATHWAIREGIADPKRICIYGASYGGYASLMGVAKEPELYRCAVGYVGVYDLPRMLREDRKAGAPTRTWLYDWIGDNDAELAGTSPNRLAERIKVPVFLAAGGEDLVAPIEHSRLMEQALRKHDVPVETLYYRNEGHGFHDAANREEYYSRLLKFLDKHLAPDSAPAQ